VFPSWDTLKRALEARAPGCPGCLDRQYLPRTPRICEADQTMGPKNMESLRLLPTAVCSDGETCIGEIGEIGTTCLASHHWALAKGCKVQPCKPCFGSGLRTEPSPVRGGSGCGGGPARKPSKKEEEKWPPGCHIQKRHVQKQTHPDGKPLPPTTRRASLVRRVLFFWLCVLCFAGLSPLLLHLADEPTSREILPLHPPPFFLVCSLLSLSLSRARVLVCCLPVCS
jgi:hypothetical protein